MTVTPKCTHVSTSFCNHRETDIDDTSFWLKLQLHLNGSCW